MEENRIEAISKELKTYLKKFDTQNLLDELKHCILNLPYWLMIENIEILQHGECSNLGSHSCKKTIWLLCIIAYHHEMVIQLREHRLDSLSEAFVGPCGRCPVLLVQPVRDIKGDVGCLKQVQLDRSTQIALVAQNRTVAVLPLHVLKILQVMHIGCGHVIGVYDSADATQGVKLVAVIVHVLRCAVAPGRSMVNVRPSHLAPVGSCILADLHGLGVNAEDSLAAVYSLGYGLTDILTKQHRLLAALVILSTCDQVGDGSRTLSVQSVEEIILTIDTECLRCDGERHHLQIGEGGDNTATSDISFLVYLI